MSTRPIVLGVATFMISVSSWAICQDPHVRSSNDLSNNRAECLKEAKFILPAVDMAEVQTPKFKSHLINPKSKLDDIANGSTVYCRFHYQKQNGTSAKFRCARTNESNQLMDNKGQVVPEATQVVVENDEAFLADQNGNKIFKEVSPNLSKAVKASIMKVRYLKGDERNVENYTSAAASRVLWALGIPAHANIMTEKVVCFGCSADPFEVQKKPLTSSDGRYVAQPFPDASIEVKFKGERLYDPTEKSWSWATLNSMSSRMPENQRIEMEVFALAGQFLGFTGSSDLQNAIVCQKFSDTNPNVCESVVAMTHDIGGSFGTRFKVNGKPAPRGDLNHFMAASVFKPGTCEFAFADGGKELPRNISRRGQAEFLARSRSLTRDNLKTIFSASHMGRLRNADSRINPSDLEDRWAQAVEMRLAEIQKAPCP